MFMCFKKLIVICMLIFLPGMTGATVAAELPEPLSLISKSIVSVSLRDRNGEELASATGFIVSEQGIVATSYFAVSRWKEPANSLVLKTFDGTKLVAEEVIAADASQGIALLRTTETALPALRLQPEYTFNKDTACYVVGGPAGPRPLLLKGKIRKRLPGGEVVEIAARLSQESRGAPVLNHLGEVVAVVAHPLEKSGSSGVAVTGAVVRNMLLEYRTRLLSRAWFELGLLYDAERGRAPDAAAAFKEAARLDPDYIEAYNNLSVVYGKAGKYEESVGVLRQVLALKPDFVEANFNLGIAYNRLGKYPEAVAVFQKLLGVRPNDADAHYLLSVAYLGLKDYTAARKELEVLSILDMRLSGKLEKLLVSGERTGNPGK